VLVAANVASFYQIRILNGSGTTINTLYVGLTASGSVSFSTHNTALSIPNNGKIQVFPHASLTGLAAATVIYAFVGCS
jgi:hypothetical protein